MDDLAQFVSDAVSSLEPPVSAEEIAELYLDQHPEIPEAKLPELLSQISYYL